MSLLVAGRAIMFGNTPRMDQSIFNNVGSFADCGLHFLTIDSLNSFCVMHGPCELDTCSGMCQLRCFRIINSSTQKLGIQRLGKLHPARMFFNSVSCRFSCRGSFWSKHTCLDIQTPPEKVFGPVLRCRPSQKTITTRDDATQSTHHTPLKMMIGNLLSYLPTLVR